MTPAYLGLGSNLGDRTRLLTDAVRLLRATTGIQVTAVSPVYDTVPVGVTGQPNYEKRFDIQGIALRREDAEGQPRVSKLPAGVVEVAIRGGRGQPDDVGVIRFVLE